METFPIYFMALGDILPHA